MIRKISQSGAPPRERSLNKDAAIHGEAFPVVAIGASAGGLEAYKEFFQALPSGTGMAFVVVQHLDPSHHSMLTEIIAKSTAMPVEEVKSGVRIKPDCVYVIPPNAFMSISESTFTLTPRSKGPSQPLAVNFFMRSLAESQGAGAIGIVFSGTGADGTLGLEDIKAEGGITFAQEPSTARYDGMPRSAIDNGCVDFVLPPKDIAKEIERIRRHPYLLTNKETNADRGEDLEDAAAPQAGPEKDLAAVLDQLRKSSGVDFSQYKTNTIHRRTLRRMVILKLDSLNKYAQHLKVHPEEADQLFDDVLIPVTSFFRDFEAFEALKTQVYPVILKDKSKKNAIRMWAPGCSTGEETYSLAMTLLEFLGDKAPSFQVQIFGTDLNEKGIEKARAGIYRESIAEEISSERMSRFFLKVDGGYRVNKAVRDMCVFARQNLASDPPFSQMDLVACRNLLIYIQPALQKKIIPILHYALKPSGFLVLGSSESLSAFPDLFSIVNKKHKIFSKKPAASRLSYDFGRSYLPAGSGIIESPRRGEKLQGSLEHEIDIQAEADRIVLKNHSPAGVVVNRAMEVVHFRGRTAPYLEPAPGKPSLNVLKLARNGLAIELRTLIGAAIKKDALILREGVSFNSNGHRRILNLSVTPLGDKGPQGRNFFLVLFDHVTPTATARSTQHRKTKEDHENKPELKRLRQELLNAQEALRSAIESEDALKEEFQSANEEILSANEELQSTNEELETSKEELQSTNEELNTLNDELRNRNFELGQANNDLANLLDAIRIPILLVGADLRIRRITSLATDIFHVLPSDVGRPITDIRNNLQVPDLAKLIRHTITNLSPIQREVQDVEGHWRSLEIRPYRRADNRIEGAVVALPDIDRLKHTEDYLKQIIDNMPVSLLVLDGELKVLLANSTFCSEFHVSQTDTVGRHFYRLGNEQWNIPQLRQLLEKVLPEKTAVKDFSVTHDFPDIGQKTMLVSGKRVDDVRGTIPPVIFLAIEDITERELTATTSARLAAVVESSDDAIITKDLNGIIQTWNPGAERIFGYTQQEAVGKPITMLFPADRISEEERILEHIRRGEHIEHYESVRRRKDGSLLNVSLTISPLVDATGQIVGASKIARNITERKQTEAALIKSEKLAVAGQLAAVLAHEINNPLQAVTNLVAILGRSPNMDSRDQEFVRTAADELSRVNRLTQQSLRFYRESNSPTLVNVEEEIESVLDLYAKRIATKNITVTKQYQADGASIISYPGEIRQIFSTLLINAMDAVPIGGRFALRISQSADWRKVPTVDGLRVTLADSGCGIPAHNASRIFEPFFTTKGENGTGLGLWVARGIADRIGGSIRMRSRVHPDNGGTCFSVFLPNRPHSQLLPPRS